MPVPDKVIFGIDENRESITFGDVRKITDEDKLIELLKYRLDTYLLNQVEQTKTPFPLSVLVCVGTETLGQIFISDKQKNKKKDGKVKISKEVDSYRFITVFKKFHQNFSRGVGKKFKKNLGDLWDGKDVDSIETLADLVYKFFRNTMIHGYQGRGVYLSLEDTQSFKKEDDGYLVLNPNWLWFRYKEVYNDLFNEAKSDKENNPIRENCLKYIKKLLN